MSIYLSIYLNLRISIFCHKTQNIQKQKKNNKIILIYIYIYIYI